MIPIYTSYFGKMKKITANYAKPYFISICGWLPNQLCNYMDTSLGEFAPSRELLSKYKIENIGPEAYTSIYLEELSNTLKNGGDDLVKVLTSVSNHDAVFLLCYEKPLDFCHRHILSKELNKRYDLNIIEWSEECLN